MEPREREEKQREIDNYISTISNTGRYSNDVIALVKKDMEYGLSKEQVKLYLTKRLDITKSKVYSECLRQGYDLDEIDIITANHMNGYQMQVALEFREKGVSIETIREITNDYDSAKSMKEAFESILNQNEKLEEAKEQEPEYVVALLEEMKGIVSKIQYQEDRYDALNKKLSIFETTKKDEEERDNLLKENAEKDKLLSEQQDTIGKANAKIATLRDDMEELEGENKKMKQMVENLKDEIAEKDSVIEKLKKDKVQEKEITAKDKSTPTTRTFAETKETEGVANTVSSVKGDYDMPVCFTIPVIDQYGRILNCVPMDRTEKKTTGLMSLIAKIGFLKKSRQSILKKVVSGDLIPAQIVQLKSGMEKGLSEDQLLPLIENNVSAEKMEVIIELVLAENKRNGLEG